MNGQQIQKVYLRTRRKTVVKGKLKALMPYKLKLLIEVRENSVIVLQIRKVWK